MIRFPLLTLTTLALVLQWMREFLIVTLAASIVTQPEMSKPSMTVPGVVMFSAPLDCSLTPAGTPVLPAPGRPWTMADLAGTVGNTGVDAFEGLGVGEAAGAVGFVAERVGDGVGAATCAAGADDGPLAFWRATVFGLAFVVATCFAAADSATPLVAFDGVGVDRVVANTSRTAGGSAL